MVPNHHESFCCSSANTMGTFMTPVKAANQALHLVESYSRNFDPKKYKDIVRFDRKELIVGKLLGEGSYNVVHEICSIEIQDNSDDTKSENSDDSAQIELRSKMLMASNCLRVEDSNENARYAIKYLKPATMEGNYYRYLQGVVDIVREAAILSSLSHPNIIKLRGLSSDGTAGFDHSIAGNYFLVLDRLYDTLEQRIGKWVTQHKNCKNKLRKVFQSSSFSLENERKNLANRLLVAYDIAQALKYLHQRNIMFRDLKPQNIGFDVRGDVKIFDFGIALELFPSQQMENGLYRIPGGNVGTAIYRAPEVKMDKPYNLSADVYSFGILLWQICTLKDPFSFLHDDEKSSNFEKKLKHFSYQMQLLIRSCCSNNIFERPTISTVIQTLKKEITCLDSDQNHQTISSHLDDRYYRRRSSTAIGA